MDARTKIREAMGLIDAEGWARTAAAMPPPPVPPQNGGGLPGQPGSHHSPPGAEQSGTRRIPKNHKFDPKSLKPLARMLFAMSVSLGHALQAYRTFNRVKSSSVSPDGMLGGRGYVMKVTELRQKLYDACEALSMISDTVHDEINAPHWKPRIAELDKGDFDAIDRLIGESESILDNPEGESEDDEEEAEKTGKPSKNWPPKGKGGPGSNKKDGPASDLPSGGDNEFVQKSTRPKQAGYDRRSSTFNTDELDGPRVKHLDRLDSDQRGPFGTYGEEPATDDTYPDVWEKDWHGDQNRLADSGLPTDDSNSKALDFGIGDGSGDGGGLRYGPAGQEGGQKVWVPSAGLPDDPAGDVHPDESGSTETITHHLDDRIKQARQFLTSIGVSEIPNDNGDGVARSDYYDGDKPDNQMNTVRGDTELPGDAESEMSGEGDFLDTDTTNPGYRYRRQDQPHTKRGL